MPQQLLLLLLVLPAFFLSSLLPTTEARSVEFALTADWPTWPLSSLQEAAEYLASEVEGDESLLWTLVDVLERSPGREQFDRAALAERFQMEDLDAVWALTLNETAGLLHPLSQSMLHLYLSLRAYSPTLEMHRSLRKGRAFRAAVATATAAAAAAAGEESGCNEGTSISWALVSPGVGQEGKVVCDATKLEEALQTAAVIAMKEGGKEGGKEDTRVLPFDHVYPSSSSSSSSSVVVTLYATLGTTDFYSFHHPLASQAATGKLTYVLRHFIPSSLPSSSFSSSSSSSSNKTVPTALQGYGIYLDIKNMEYKNIDDSPAPSGGGGEGGQGEEQQQQQKDEIAIDEEVSGFLFSKLLEREPSLSTELRTLRSNLLKDSSLPSSSSSSSVTNMKVWRLRDLGLQAAQTVATAKDPLRKLVELSQNFPSHASRLSSLKVKEEYRQGALFGMQSHVLGYGGSLKPGKKNLFFNTEN
jgi:UDP-glucose:glycoprotein glucosyltransferase